jgi:hypothetical protein
MELLIGMLMGFINKIHYNQLPIIAIIFTQNLYSPSPAFIKPGFEDIRDAKEYPGTWLLLL